MSSFVSYLSEHTGDGKHDFSFTKIPFSGKKTGFVLRQALRKIISEAASALARYTKQYEWCYVLVLYK